MCKSLCKKVLLLAEYRHMYWQQAEGLSLPDWLRKVGWWNTAEDLKTLLLFWSLFFLLFSSVDITASVVTVEGVLCFYFFFWCELAPSPGLLWYDSYTTGPWIFPLNADLHFSQAKGGAAPTVCMIFDDDDDDAEGGDDDFYALWVLNEWMWHWLAETSNIFNLNYVYAKIGVGKSKKT